MEHPSQNPRGCVDTPTPGQGKTKFQKLQKLDISLCATLMGEQGRRQHSARHN